MENKAHVEGSSRQEGCENVLKMDNQSAPVESVPSYTLSKGEILAPFLPIFRNAVYTPPATYLTWTNSHTKQRGPHRD